MTGVNDNWTGAAGNGNLDDPNNWAAGVPQAGDTAVFAGPPASHLTADLVNTNGPQFSPGAIELAAGVHVMFQGSTIWRVGNLDIGFNSNFAVQGGALEAGAVSNLGVLDISQAGYIGLMGATSSKMCGTFTSMVDGFGPTPLSAVIQNYTADAYALATQNVGPDVVTGNIGFGNNNAAIENQVINVPNGGGGDMINISHPWPAPEGSGIMIDTQSTNVEGPPPPASGFNALPGYWGPMAYTQLFASPDPQWGPMPNSG